MRRLLLPIMLFGSTAACATLLDFQEPTDRITTTDGTDRRDAQTPDVTSNEAKDAASRSPTVISPPNEPAETDASASVEREDAATTVEPKDAATAVEPACSSCVPYAPAGWRGPFVVAESASSVPDCGSDYPVSAYTGHTGFRADPAQCSCSCGSPTDVSCSAPTTSFFGDSQCQTPACHVDSNVHACSDRVSCDVGSAKVAAVSFSASTPSGGRCAPAATTKVNAATWQKAIRLCAPSTTQADCTDGVCQPTPSPLFASKNRCVIHDGDSAVCPSAFPARQVFYTGGDDTRACSACQCGEPQGTTCAASVTTGTSGTCKDPSTVIAPSGCVAMAANDHIVVTAGTPRDSGSCAPNGGTPIGAFDPGAPTTVCCLE